MQKRCSILVCLIILTGLSACTTTPSPSGISGIEGYVTEGPTCPGPVPIGGNECQDRPYQATISVLTAEGKLVTQFQTDIDGYFKIPLSPGTYNLHPESGNPMPNAAEQTVVVNENQYTQVSILYDTGMR
ncbi:MAG TPA: carboxypeptidase-like regulatory domain-containing protein [Anaerolineales bacterium]